MLGIAGTPTLIGGTRIIIILTPIGIIAIITTLGTIKFTPALEERHISSRSRLCTAMLQIPALSNFSWPS